ncbi:A disintegrin and metalloproteinase with thrombospondin motifs like [Ptiloglossa arizonensis]|uniref:A disintegrin and metalloproteinase with thrombospondin motifs like n=1 Tax=Ptiloglossa arizonensis TaxID=3350558 RepID=UPI003FA0C9D1
MYILIYLYLTAFPFIHSIRLHELMTADEVMGIFQTTYDAVPKYEVVRVLCSFNVANENDSRKMHIKAFAQEIELFLKLSNGYLASEDTPLWMVNSNQHALEGLQYTLIPNALKDIGTPMQDEKAGAAILVTLQNNMWPVFDGFLPSNLVIRSLPERVIRDILHEEDGLFEPFFNESNTTNDLFYTYHHIVYEMIPSKKYEDFNIANPIPNRYQIPEVIYPEILVVVDYSLYLMLGKDLNLAKRYIVAFWNGVDLRYRSMTNPKIRLNIAGIIIGMDMCAIPYIEKSRVDSKLVDADKALSGMAKYFYQEKRIPWNIYDIAMSTTHFDLCTKLDEHLCDPATLGYSYVGGACNRNFIKKTSSAVAVAEDNGGFSGIIPVAHELGHLLGSHHDGDPRDPGNCSSNDGYLMSSTLTLDENQFKLSNCSLNALRKFISEDRAKCLYDEPPKATAIRTILPGKLMSLDEQCRKVYGGGACNKNSSSVCYRLDCEVLDSNGECAAIAAAAEGSSCETNGICLDGQCVLEGTETKQERSYISEMK